MARSSRRAPMLRWWRWVASTPTWRRCNSTLDSQRTKVLLHEIDTAVLAVRRALRASRVKQGVGRLAQDAVTELQRPQAIDHQRRAGAVADGAQQLAGSDVKGVDLAVAEIAHQQIIAEGAEVGRRHRQAPWRVQHAAWHYQVLDQGAAGIKLADHAQACTLHLDLARGVLLGIADKDAAADRLDTIRRVTGRYGRVLEGCRQGDRLEVCVEHVDMVILEIGRVNQVGAIRVGNRQALVDGAAGAIVDDGQGMRAIDGRRPGGDGASLARKDETAGASRAAGADLEVGRATGKNDTGRLGRTQRAWVDTDHQA